nr:choice-of-anchor D domain-containing protein [uncultured Psychroserpens sp.]
MKKNYSLILLAFLCVFVSYGQVSENFDGFTSGGYGNYSYNNFDINIGLSETTNARSGRAVRLRNTSSSNLEYVGTDGNGKDGGIGDISFWYRSWDNSPAAVYDVQISINNGAYSNIGAQINTTSTTYAQWTHTLNNSSDNIKVRVLRVSGERLIIDDFEITDLPTDPDLSISGTTDHGSSCLSTAATTIQYTITNSGTLTANGINVSSDDAQFVVSGLSSTTIAASGTATYNVTFTPTAVGAQTATITVTSSTGTSNSPTSDLTGTGITLPTISTQPTNQSVIEPNTATFSVVSSDATSYQWEINTGSGWNNVTGGSGATTDTYTTPATSTTMDGDLYRCIVTNTCGSTTSNAATLNVSVIADVVITEIMYNTPTPGNDYEWIEICNLNGTSQDISDYTIDVNGTTRFTFPSSTTIPANSCITVLLGDDGSSSPECSFTPDYGSPSSTNILPNSPSAAGVDIELIASDSTTVVDIVNYDDADGADGNGASLHVTNATIDNSDTGSNWQEVMDGGSPGANTLLSPCSAPEIQLKNSSGVDQACGAFTIDFGSQAIGYDTDLTFDIVNEGTLDLVVTSLPITGTNPGDFSIVSPIITVPLIITSGNTQTVTVRFTPIATGNRTASLRVTNNDANEASCFINLQGIGTTPIPDIDVERNTFATIPDGSPADNGFNTIFAQTPVNSTSLPKTYYIRNEGTADLNVTSISLSTGTNFNLVGLPTLPFTLSPSDSPVSFEVEFAPINPVGTKTDEVIILSNDPDTSEATYTFRVQGDATCSTTSISLFPESGPAGTIVTVSGTGNNFDGSTTIDFGGNSLPVTFIDSNTLEVTIPTASVSGEILLTDSGCTSTDYFTIIDSVFGGCEGANPSTDLVIYELYDENPGNGGMITVYNGTNATVDLSDYKLSRTTNYTDQVTFPYVDNWYLPSGNLAPGELFRLKISSSACSDAFYTTPYDVISATGFNSNDGIQLRRTSDNSVIDEVLTPNFVGFYMYRNTTTLNPANPYNPSFWNTDTLTANECRVVGVAPTLAVPPPTVSVLNDPTFNCSTSVQLSVTGGQGVAGGLGLNYQWYYLVPNTTTFVVVPNSADFNNVSTNSTLDILNPIAYIDYQFYCQVREDTITCFTASNAVRLEAIGATWNGTSWSSVPTSSKIAIIDGDYDTSINTNGETSFEACQLIVNTNYTLSIENNTFVRVQNDLTVNGNIIVKTDGAFVQVDDAAIVDGDVLTTRDKITVEKETAPLATYREYTYWSSPVSGETIGSGLFESSSNRRFWFNGQNFRDSTQETNNDNATAPGQDDIDDDANDWQLITNAATVMDPGVGYAATHSSTGFTPNQYIYTFDGPFNNGVFNIPIYRNDVETNDNNWNFIGNPYPSAIDADDFLAANASIDQTVGATNGAIFFWSHNTAADDNTNGNEAQNYSQSDYAIINGTGQTAGGDAVVPNRFIPSGQGFFVSMDDAAASTSAGGTLRTTDIVFNNSMRVIDNNAQFFRNDNSSSPNKIRLDLNTDNGVFNQILVGYVNGATDGDDGMYYDAHKNLSANANSIIYTILNSSDDKKFAIQGKAPNSLTLEEVIPLGFYTAIDEATLYTISIAELEGEFMNENTVYIKDKLLNIIHDLSTNNYTFTSEVGEFNDRFEIVFQPESLSVNENDFSPDDLSIIELGDGDVKFSVGNSLVIKQVEIMDIVGRTIYKLQGNHNVEVYNLSRLSQAAYIARVTLSNGQIITKKALKRH